MTTTEIKFNRTTAESLAIYAPAFLEVLRVAKITADPVKVMEDSDEFHRLAKIDQAEWLIGWFHGVAEAHGVSLELVWAEARRVVDLDTKPARKRRKAA